MNKKLTYLSTILASILSFVLGVLYIFNDYPLWYSIITFTFFIIIIIKLLYKNNFSIKILEQSVVLNIKNTKGNVVDYRCEKKIICTGKYANEINYSLSASGKIENYKIKGGILKSIEVENGRTLLTVEFTKPLKKDEKTTIELHCQFINSFENEEEKWTLTRNYPSNGAYNLTVIFPKKRPYKSYKSIQKTGHHREICKVQPEETLIETLPALRLKIKNLKIKKEFQLIWTW